jgi:hypothetical protein
MSIDRALFAQTQRVIFFDIDATLTNAVDHSSLLDHPTQEAFKQQLFDESWKTIMFADFRELHPSSLALFACLLRQTGAKAVCISSWNTDDVGYVAELKAAFERFADFPDGWLLGYSGGCGGQRDITAIKPFMEETGFDGEYIALDDGAFEYLDQSRAIIVDGRLGFTIYDYQKALALFSITDRPALG